MKTITIEPQYRLFTESAKNNRDNVLKFVNELETTTKKQGTGVLRSSDDHYCCLGVACELFGVCGDLQGTCYSYLGKHNKLPDIIAESLGFVDVGGSYTLNHSTFETLWKLNDFRHFSFKEIAQAIRDLWFHQFGEVLS